MSECYMGEIRLLPYMRGAPSGWQICDGSLLSVSMYSPLFQLLGTTYGGDGQQNFAVPDLRSRVPLHQGTGAGLTTRVLGQAAGQESVTLTTQQMGAHAHFPLASTTSASSKSPASTVLAAVPSALNAIFYNSDAAKSTAVPFPGTTLQPSGASQGHDNTAPTLTLQYCIAIEGIFPPRPS